MSANEFFLRLTENHPFITIVSYAGQILLSTNPTELAHPEAYRPAAETLQDDCPVFGSEVWGHVQHILIFYYAFDG